MKPGCLVRFRRRDWVLLPSDDSAIYLLRPLTGSTEDVVAVHKRLADIACFRFPEERLEPATFPLPTPDHVADATAAHLLWQAARLTLREGATPLRSLGRISIRPRAYQLVPLLMALRLDPVRILIADDVGVGKTIEALLIARELLDRGEVKRLCVLCPPYLCDQWQKELAEKFHLDAVVIRSGTVSQLERGKPFTQSIYRYYPIQVASIDFLKSDRNKHSFLQDCPELVIVDEAHGAVAASPEFASRHQRHELVREIAKKEDRHLILLTATPHSGIEAAFRCLLSLLNPKFEKWDTSSLSEQQRAELALHFVQRTRRDIVTDWAEQVGQVLFPERVTEDRTYRLSPEYRKFFNEVYEFCSGIVRSGEKLDRWRQKRRYWGALGLLRCVMSSPAAALTTLGAREKVQHTDEEEPDFSPFIFESGYDQTYDDHPIPPVEAAAETLSDTERRSLRRLAEVAETLPKADTKLVECCKLVKDLLRSGFHPIVWCRYIATADYVAKGLEEALRNDFPEIRVVSITGVLGDEERRAKIEELAAEPCRVLVATDCLSEGINLQHAFDAVIHYDLPWNPNRLDQREGRVDRYGQPKKQVKAIRYYSPDSPVDGVVIKVLLDKAREIHRVLGTYVPVPEEDETVMQALLNALFLRPERKPHTQQLEFDFGEAESTVRDFHKRWDQNAEREKTNRTRFAQRAIKVDEVQRELEATDNVLGDPHAVREFVLAACQRLGIRISNDKRPGVFQVVVDPQALAGVPEVIRFALPTTKQKVWSISFDSPTPEGAEFLGRNHRFVATLARYLMEEALTRTESTAARCGVVRTKSVARVTTILLLRVRYLVELPEQAPLLSEEVLIRGFRGGLAGATPDWLPEEEAFKLLAGAKPDANISPNEKKDWIKKALETWPTLEKTINEQISARAKELEDTHKRIRKSIKLRVRELVVVPQFPADLLGILVLVPVVGP